MYKRILTMAMILALAVSAFGVVGSARASARTANWQVSIAYQNVGSAATPVTVNFYPEGSSTPVSYDPLSGGTIPQYASREFYIGSVGGLSSPFTGNAVMSANQPLVATVIQYSPDAGFIMRMLSNGFQQTDVSDQYLISSALANTFNQTVVFSIQNTGATSVNATVKFVNANTGNTDSTIIHSIPANSSKLIEMDNTADTGLGTTTFNGSAVITVPSGSGIVASASNLWTNQNIAENFEGIPLGRTSQTIYMASALCNYYEQQTYFGVQNASTTTSTSITVYYKNLDGTDKTTDGPYTVNPGAKKTIITCSPSTGMNMSNFTGTARIVSSTTPIAVVGKCRCPNVCTPPERSTLWSTAWMGESSGYSRLAAPRVRWASNTNYFDPLNVGAKQRTYMAFQNLEAFTIKVNVKYYDKFGALVATHLLTIPSLSKGTSNAQDAGAKGLNGMNPDEFGYYPDGSFGGSVIIEAHPDNPTAKFIGVIRTQHPGAAEDYNPMPVP